MEEGRSRELPSSAFGPKAGRCETCGQGVDYPVKITSSLSLESETKSLAELQHGAGSWETREGDSEEGGSE